MPSQSLYRKYRPQTFSDVVGQEHIEQTLRNALSANRISHAYLFCGPRGTGKTTTARLLAKALLCEQAPTANPCGVCQECTNIAEGVNPDVYELDAASHTGVDNVREEIISRVAFSPTRGRYKVYIIDEVHMLSTPAFNALLKTLEEPPAHVVFIMCTTDPQKVPVTIISRCQRFDFRSLTNEEIERCLVQICEGEGFDFDTDAIELIAKQAHGGMRDAITSLEQVAVFGNGSINMSAAQNMFGDMGTGELAEVFSLIASRDVPGCFRWVQEASSTGIDVARIAKNMVAYARDIFVVSLGGQLAGVDVDAEDTATLERLAEDLGGSDRIAGMLIALGDLISQLRTAADARLALEICLTRMAHPKSDLTLESLSARISALESGAALGAVSQDAVATKPDPISSEPTQVAVESTVEPSTEPEVELPGSAETESTLSPATSEDLLADSASVRRLWDSAARMLGSMHGVVPSLLGGVVAHGAPERSSIVLELPPDAAFAKKMLQSGEIAADLVACVQKAFGKKVGVEFSLGAPEENSDISDSKAAEISETTPTSAVSEPPVVAPAAEQPSTAPEPAHREIPLGAKPGDELAELFVEVFGDGVIFRPESEED